MTHIKEGGRLVIPLGSTTFYQNLTVATKKGKDIGIEQLGAVSFVPMTGEMASEMKR